MLKFLQHSLVFKHSQRPILQSLIRLKLILYGQPERFLQPLVLKQESIHYRSKCFIAGLFMLVTGLLSSVGALAQVSAYSFASSSGATLEEMTGSTQLVGAGSDDGASSIQILPFTFIYNGTAYTQISANANGLAKLGSPIVTSAWNNDLTLSANNPKIAPYWDDLHTGSTAGGGKVHSKVIGTAPNQKYVIEWFVTVPRSTSGGASAKFQLWLNETTNTIQFVYGTDLVTNSGNYSVGLTTSSTDYISVTTSTTTSSSSTANNSNTVAITNGTIYTFTPPTCIAPTGLTAGSIISNAATLSWNSVSSATNGYLVRYKATADAPTVATWATPTAVASGTSLNLAGLNANTQYEFQVQADCGSGTTSNFSASTNFTTLCNPITTLPFTEDFETTTGTALPSCWSFADANNDGKVWASTTSYKRTGTRGAFMTWNSSLAMNDWFFSPGIQLTAGKTYDISFWYNNGNSTTYTESMELKWGFSPSVAGMTQATSFNDPNIGATYKEGKVSLTPSVTDVYYFGWHGYSIANQFALSLDDITIRESPALNVGVIALATPATSGCYSTSENISVTIHNFSFLPIDFSVNPTTVSVNVTGAVTQNFSVLIDNSILAAGATMNVPVGMLNMAASGTYTFNGSATVAGDGDTSNDAMPQTTRTVTPIATLPQLVDFTGFTGSNLTTGFPDWKEAAGATKPSGTSSNWTSAATSQATFLGSATAKLNFATSTSTVRQEWIVGPKVTATATTALKLKAAVTSSGGNAVATMLPTDSLKIMVSADCGETFVSAGAITGNNNLTNALTDFTFNLSAYAGQNIIVALMGKTGTARPASAYDLHIDDLFLGTPPSTDLGISVIISPGTGCGLSNQETISVTVNNFGADVQTNIPLQYSINNGTPVTEVMAGPLAAGASATYNFSTKANLSVAGFYTIVATTTMSGDADTSNDSASGTLNSIPLIASFPHLQDFENGAGGWVAGGTSSSWALGTPTGTVINSAGGGSNSWVTNLAGTYNNNEQSHVTGPCFNFSSLSQPVIELKIWWNMENNYEKAALQSSIDGGLTWQHIGAFGDPDNWYNNNSTSGPGVGGVKEGWSGRASSSNGSNGWLTAKHELTGLGGQSSVLLRIAFGSDGSGQDDGFAFDDISIYEKPALDAGITAVTSPTTATCDNSLQTVTVIIQNFGANSLSNIPVSYSVNGGPAVNEVFAGPLAASATATYSFTTQVNLNASTYSISARTNMIGDGNAANDVATLSGNMETPPTLIASVSPATVYGGDTIKLSADSPLLNGVRITELTLYRTGTGQTATFPAYVATGDDDFIELTNLSNANADISGFKLEILGSGARIYSFPANTNIPANATLLLHIGTGTDDPANYYYHTGGSNNPLSSGANSGFILRFSDDAVLDAVALNTYTFPASTGVTAADWSGSASSPSGAAGSVLINSDNNSGTNWSPSTTTTQTIGTRNSSLANITLTAITWTGPNGFTATDKEVTTTAPVTPGNYDYTATITSGTCTVNAVATLTVVAPAPPVAAFTADTTTATTGGLVSTVTFTDESTNLPDTWAWTFSPGTVTFVNGTSASSQNPQVQFGASGQYTVSLTASNANGISTETKVNYITVIVGYCTSAASTPATDEDIGNVTFGTLSNGSATPVTSNSTAINGYSDFTTLPAPSIQKQVATPISVSIINAGISVYTTRVNVFIDFNQNGVFDLPGERVFNVNVPANQTMRTVTGNIFIPASALIGNTRMRVIANETTTVDLNPCGTYSWGETEDYTIEIAPAPALNIAATGLATPITTGCYTANEIVEVTIQNTGSATIDFSNDPTTVSVNVSGAATQTLSAILNADTLAVGASMNVIVGTLNMAAPGTYTFNGSATVAGDGDTSNDAMPQTTRTVAPFATLPQLVDFTGFTGNNLTTFFPDWKEAAGAAKPSGTSSAWTSATTAQATFLGSATARLNFTTFTSTTRNEWIVGPKVTATATTALKLKAAVTSSAGNAVASMLPTDSLKIMISTDCGETFVNIGAITGNDNLTNSLTDFIFDLSAYNGQNIIVALMGKTGTPRPASAYDLHVDDIFLGTPPALDIDAIAIASLPTSGCYSANEPINVTILNNGTALLDFSVNPVTVTVNVTGAVTQTLSTIISSGTLAAGATQVVLVDVLDMYSTGGTYTFNGNATVAGDGNTSNDAMPATSRTVIGLASLPQNVNFTNFNGSNIATLFAGWSEATGSVTPSGNTSAWSTKSFGNVTNNINGTAAHLNIFSNSKNEWLIGPKVTATATTELRFDLALTLWNNTNAGTLGSDDAFKVMISTDCGSTYAALKTFNASTPISNTGQKETINLSAYAGQDIIVAFFAIEGSVNDPEDVDLFLDNIFIGDCTPGLWNGQVSTDWNTPENWSCNTVPTANANVTVPAGAKNYPQLASGTAQANDLTIATGASVSINGGTLQLTGNLTNNGTFSNTTGTLELTGLNGQLLSGVNSLVNLTVNGSGTKSISSNLLITNALTMTSGLLNTEGSKITLTDTAQISETNTSYVLGQMETTRNLSTSALANFGGMGLELTPAAGSIMPGVTTARRVTGTQMNAGGPGYSIPRYFDIQSAVNADLNVTMVFHYLDHEVAAYNEANLVLYRSGNQGGSWAADSATVADPANNLVTLNGISRFSYWTAGDLNAPLPVELIAFKATAKGNDALLTWTTASETNSKGFEVQVSANSFDFRELGFVASHNSSTLQQYNFTDAEKGKNGMRYYRLKQIDLDGAISYSPIKAVNFQTTATLVHVYPNPFSATFNLAIESAVATEVPATITDLTGKTVWKKQLKVEKGENQLKLNADEKLPAGIYLLHLLIGDQHFTTKLIKQ